MESVDVGSGAKLEKQLYQIYRDFMTRVTKLDELVAAGNNSLTSFQQGLEFLRRPLLDRRSELFESIVKANETSRLNAYFDGGCFMNNLAKQNLVKSKALLSEMKSFLEVATTTIEALNEFSSASYLSSQECIMDQNITLPSHMFVCKLCRDYETEGGTRLFCKPETCTNGAHPFDGVNLCYDEARPYNAGKDRVRSELEVLSEELSSYCMMWSLQPYINDEMMQEAWKLVK